MVDQHIIICSILISIRFILMLHCSIICSKPVFSEFKRTQYNLDKRYYCLVKQQYRATIGPTLSNNIFIQIRNHKGRITH